MKKKISKKNLTVKTTPSSVLFAKGINEVHEKGVYSFFTDVYDVVRQIPKGRVTSYGAIAAYLGTKLSARMVGWAMNAAHTARPKVPAQRVVNRNGMLTGKHHFEGTNLMQQLLESEGIQVIDNRIIDFKKHFWEPDF